MYQIIVPPITPSPQVQPVLEFSRDAWVKLMLYVENIGVEINGFAFVEMVKPSMFIVFNPDDVFITEQEVSSASAEVDGNVFARALYAASQQKRSGELKLQWHSHVMSSAVFSPQDRATMESYANGGMNWFISLVVNKRGEASARLDVYTPVRLSANMVIRIYDRPDDETERQVRDDIARLVTIRKPVKSNSASKNRPTPRVSVVN